MLPEFRGVAKQRPGQGQLPAPRYLMQSQHSAAFRRLAGPVALSPLAKELQR